MPLEVDEKDAGTAGKSEGETERRRREGLRLNFLLLTASVFITLTASEVVARLVLPSPLPWLFPQVRYRPDPELIFALAPNQDAFTADVPVQINSRGLRGRGIDYARPPGYHRLLFLGDSIVFGYGVSEREILSFRVEAMLREHGIKVEAINTGVPSYNTEQEVAFMAREGVRYRPDWVILGFCWNDINDKTGAQVSPDGWLVSEAAADHADRSTPLATPQSYAFRNLMKRSRLVYAALQGCRVLKSLVSPDDHAVFRGDVLAGHDTERVRRGWGLVEKAIHRLRLLGEEEGFRTLIVGFPVSLSLEKSFPQSSYPAHLREITSREHIPFLDLGPSFQEAFRGHESLFIPYDSDHPNATGHDLAARKIADLLLSHGIRAQVDP
ncbi:MAG: hypothetical protein DMH00_02625 [Acidobacteria bacterium]|nr:MAG: hypothetical protein DMH00_02625 [Acidobacteriota bacterium]